MGKTKDSDLAVMEPVDTSKPLVKEFVDKDSQIKQFITTRLPHFPNSSVSIKKVYQSRDKSVYRFRVNYHRSILEGDCIIPLNSIVASRYVEVVCKGNDYEFFDKTK